MPPSGRNPPIYRRRRGRRAGGSGYGRTMSGRSSSWRVAASPMCSSTRWRRSPALRFDADGWRPLAPGVVDLLRQAAPGERATGGGCSTSPPRSRCVTVQRAIQADRRLAQRPRSGRRAGRHRPLRARQAGARPPAAARRRRAGGPRRAAAGGRRARPGGLRRRLAARRQRPAPTTTASGGPSPRPGSVTLAALDRELDRLDRRREPAAPVRRQPVDGLRPARRGAPAAAAPWRLIC